MDPGLPRSFRRLKAVPPNTASTDQTQARAGALLIFGCQSYGGKRGTGPTEVQAGTSGLLCEQDPPWCGGPVLEIEKFAFAVITAARKLRPYFQAHPIIRLTNQPLIKIIQKPETSGRMVSWAIELGEFDIQVRPRPAIKSQILADFIVEFTAPAMEPMPVDGTSASTEKPAHGDKRDGPRSPEDENEVHWILHVDRLNLAAELGAKKLKVYSDSQLVVEQVNGTYEAKELSMKRYLQKVREKLDGMGEVEVLQVPWGMNDRADSLSKMASEETHDFGSVYTEILLHPSIDEKQVLKILTGPNWMDPIVRYLKDGILPEDKLEAWRLIVKAAHYVLHGSKLYKQSYTWPYLRCLVPFESEYALREVHEGICGDHGGERTLA
ncbi:uncharacterized protein LOC143889773 [Tasmannia lanceolata]|uniref:uncharacterized protein LOC143889773 n=1 Tax=Tasmannia lanceolata TaxID=3420 RepID=UPI004064258E